MKAPIPQSIVWSGDGTYIGCSVADDDGMLILDAASGAVRHAARRAWRVVFPKDGKRFALALLGGDIVWHDWPSAAASETFKPKEATGNVMDLRLSGDDRYLAACYTSGMIAVWDRETGTLVREVKGADAAVFVPGQAMLAAVVERRVTMIDVKTGDKKRTDIAVHDSGPLAFSPDGNRLFTPGLGFRIQVWNLTTGKELAFGDGHAAPITGLAYGPDGKSLLSAATDGLRLWNVQTLQERATARRDCSVQALALAHDGRRFVSAEHDALRIWSPVDLAKERPYPDQPSLTIERTKHTAAALAYARDGQRIAFSDFGEKLVFADPYRGTTTSGLQFAVDPIAAAFAPNGRQIVALTRDGYLHHWQIGSHMENRGSCTAFGSPKPGSRQFTIRPASVMKLAHSTVHSNVMMMKHGIETSGLPAGMIIGQFTCVSAQSVNPEAPPKIAPHIVNQRTGRRLAVVEELLDLVARERRHDRHVAGLESLALQPGDRVDEAIEVCVHSLERAHFAAASRSLSGGRTCSFTSAMATDGITFTKSRNQIRNQPKLPTRIPISM